MPTPHSQFQSRPVNFYPAYSIVHVLCTIRAMSVPKDAHLMIMDSVLWGWERFFDELSRFLRDLNRQTGVANESYCEYAVERLEVCIRSVSALLDQLRSRPPTHVADDVSDVAVHYSVQLAELLQCLRGLYTEWQRYRDDGHHLSTAYSVPTSQPSIQGRPRFIISREQICYLRSMAFSWIQIARLLGVSYSTIYRRRQEYGLTSLTAGTDITDSELREVLHQLRQELPSLGQTLIWGRLRSMGFNVTRERLRQAVRQNDPIHTALRWRGELVRRQPYSVPGPNSLWHIGMFYELYTGTVT